MKAPEPSLSLRNSYQKLQKPFHKTNTVQNTLSSIGPELRNKNNLNAFEHNLKKHYLKELGKANLQEKLLLLISLV